MKILSYAWSIYDSRLATFKKICTGGGLVIRDLCEFIGRKEQSYLFIGQYVFPEMKIGNINIVKTDYEPDKQKRPGKDDEYIQYMVHAFERAVEKVKPDIIHFHNLGDLAYQIVKEVCIKKKLRYCITYHLYIGKNPKFAGCDWCVDNEKRMMELDNLHLITVSTGMKKKIEADYPQCSNVSITPILNGTDFKAITCESDWVQKLKIGNRKVLLCAGTICYRKNQLQLLKVFNMNKFLQDNIFLIFCGRIANNFQEDFEEEIKGYGLEGCAAYIGAVDSDEMKKLYSVSDGLIMPSLSEGLSISALEAIAYGLPVIMYRSSECALDLSDENVVSFAERDTDQAMQDAIVNWYEKEWDKSYISNYSKYFTMERMADDYIDYYQNQMIL